MAGRRPRRLCSELHSRSWTLMSRHNYLTPLQNLALHEAVGIVRRGFGQADYAELFLVGSCLKKQDFRDVDVRLILSNGAYDYLFAYDDEAGSLWTLMCASIGTMLSSKTGLPIDFQIQRFVDADEKYGVFTREPLGYVLGYGGDRHPARTA